MIGVVHDITNREIIEETLRRQTEALTTLNELGHLISAELDLHKTVQAVTDAATELSGAQLGSFFYNVINRDGGSYMLYTLAGAPREAFAHFPMPRATDLFGPTFRGEGVVRIADVALDPRYGKNSPYYGMPKGHVPVTGYMAVPVISRSGEVLGGLFFGHPDKSVFTERHEQIVTGLAAQAQLIEDLLDVSRIITGKLRMDVRPAEPNLFTEAAIDALKPAAEAKGIRIQKIMDTGIVSVPGDPVRLQ